MDSLLAGMILGLWIAVPIGPMSALCIQNSLDGGFRNGFAAGLGAATVHALYAGVALAGTALAGAMAQDHAGSVQMAAAVLLFWLGCRALTRSPGAMPSGGARLRTFGCYSAAVVLTLCNPVTASLFVVAVPASSVAVAHTTAGPLPFGVFLGSAVWWLTLSGVVSVMRERLSATVLLRVSHLYGLAMIALSLLLVGQAMLQFDASFLGSSQAGAHGAGVLVQ